MAAVDGVEDPEAGASLPPLESLDFVQLFIAPTAQAIAAGGLLIEELSRNNQSFHARVCTGEPVSEYAGDGICIGIGVPPVDEGTLSLQPSSIPQTLNTMDEREQSPALDYRRAVIELARGTAPTDADDVIMGLVDDNFISSLAGTTLIHGPYSGDPATIRNWLGDDATESDRHCRSALVVATLHEHASSAMAAAIERFMAATPITTGPCATDVGAYDLLDVLASSDPGLALAVTAGHQHVNEEAKRTWYRLSQSIHETIRTIEQNQQVIHVNAQAPVAAIARLACIVTPAVDPILVTDGDQIAVTTMSDSMIGLAETLEEYLTYPIYHGDNRISGWPTVELSEIERTIAEVRP